MLVCQLLFGFNRVSGVRVNYICNKLDFLLIFIHNRNLNLFNNTITIIINHYAIHIIGFPNIA